MKYQKRIALMLALTLLYIFPVTVYAAESETGSITVEMKCDHQDVTGGTLAIYQVGRIQEEDGNYFYGKTEAMSDFPDAYDDIHSAALAEDIAAYIADKHIEPTATAKNAEGKVVFEGLELGLYLVVQTEASEGYEPLKPFLISVPMVQDDEYVYEVNAAGKFQFEQTSKPETPPDEPKDPELPGTGQLNWPVPVLTVLGLGLFSTGWTLRTKKKNSHEG